MKNYIVAGIPRSGTSLLMRVLHSGGMPVFCDPDNVGTSYETPFIFDLPAINHWINLAKGRVFKALDPHVFRLHIGYDYKILFITRDCVEQTKSQLKLLSVATRGAFVDSSRKTRKILQKSIQDDEVKCRKEFERLNAEVLELSFEDLIIHKTTTIDKICEFLNEFPLRKEIMVQQIEDRTTKCYDGFLETKFFNK